jgi:hypothetical protein
MPLQVLTDIKIPAGEWLSNGVDCSAGKIVRFTMPAGWTRAPLTFQISSDGAGYNDLLGMQNNVFSFIPHEISFPNVIPGVGLLINPETLRGVAWFKLRSGTRLSPVPQEAEREFSVAIEVP